jgi:hypothetical protein
LPERFVSFAQKFAMRAQVNAKNMLLITTIVASVPKPVAVVPKPVAR